MMKTNKMLNIISNVVIGILFSIVSIITLLLFMQGHVSISMQTGALGLVVCICLVIGKILARQYFKKQDLSSDMSFLGKLINEWSCKIQYAKNSLMHSGVLSMYDNGIDIQCGTQHDKILYSSIKSIKCDAKYFYIEKSDYVESEIVRTQIRLSAKPLTVKAIISSLSNVCGQDCQLVMS